MRSVSLRIAFERLHRFARHRVLQHDANLGEVVAQRAVALSMPQGLRPSI
jgi:hypothetical protein